VSIASKLQLKPGQQMAVVGERRGADLQLDPDVIHDDPKTADVVIVFVTCTPDLEALGLVAEGAAMRGAGAWIAYPKAGQLGTDLNRDSLAAKMTTRGLRPVRQIAIDTVWSALRFRQA
jgi:hypothetical protein